MFVGIVEGLRLEVDMSVTPFFYIVSRDVLSEHVAKAISSKK